MRAFGVIYATTPTLTRPATGFLFDLDPCTWMEGYFGVHSSLGVLQQWHEAAMPALVFKSDIQKPLQVRKGRWALLLHRGDRFLPKHIVTYQVS